MNYRTNPMCYAAVVVLLAVLAGGCAPKEPQADLSASDGFRQAETVCLSGVDFPADSAHLTLKTMTESDAALLAGFPNLQSIQIESCDDPAVIAALAAGYPDLEVSYQVLLAGTSCAAGTETLELDNPDSPELMRKLALFPQLRTVTLTGTLPETEELIALKEAYPNITFLWEFEMFGIPVNTMTEFVDLSGVKVGSTDAVERWLPCFYNLKQVDMLRCGLSNEDMEAMNQRHRETKFVWDVAIGDRVFRTDMTYFMPHNLKLEVNNEICKNLKYFHDLIVLDLGHKQVSDVSFLEYMPKMQYLLLADTPLKDVELVGQMQDLVFLEIFLTDVVDISPLLNCSKLMDLNLSLAVDVDITPVYQMTWLDRLWILHRPMTDAQKAELNDALPNTMIGYIAPGSTRGGWRMSPNYYKMRDIIGMWYSIY